MRDSKVHIDELPPAARARVMAQIEEVPSNKKRVRPVGVCAECGNSKPTYNHVDGDESKPLCGACSMKLHRQSPGAVQTKVSKVGMQAIGTLDSLLGLPGVEEKQRDALQQMQDGLKLMVRGWLGDTSVGETYGTTVIPSSIPMHGSSHKGEDTGDWTDNKFIKACVGFVGSTLQPLESDPNRFAAVATAITNEILKSSTNLGTSNGVAKVELQRLGVAVQ